MSSTLNCQYLFVNAIKGILHFILGYMSVCAWITESKPLKQAKLRNENFDSL